MDIQIGDIVSCEKDNSLYTGYVIDILNSYDLICVYIPGWNKGHTYVFEDIRIDSHSTIWIFLKNIIGHIKGPRVGNKVLQEGDNCFHEVKEILPLDPCYGNLFWYLDDLGLRQPYIWLKSIRTPLKKGSLKTFKTVDVSQYWRDIYEI